ncbi:MAG: hypothetical protein DDT29_01629 [Dehalococcoidia bacterium]|nr:hypothetical protein [Bacillota bacterium]
MGYTEVYIDNIRGGASGNSQKGGGVHSHTLNMDAGKGLKFYMRIFFLKSTNDSYISLVKRVRIFGVGHAEEFQSKGFLSRGRSSPPGAT